ncbi:MAG: hypothetical protein K6L60_15085 [Oceanobacter sp.]|jgi:hypothetical protein
MPDTTPKSSTLEPGPSIKTPRLPDFTQEKFQELSELGIDSSILAAGEPVGLSSASGPEEYQADIDRWIDSGGT